MLRSISACLLWRLERASQFLRIEDFLARVILIALCVYLLPGAVALAPALRGRDRGRPPRGCHESSKPPGSLGFLRARLGLPCGFSRGSSRKPIAKNSSKTWSKSMRPY